MHDINVALTLVCYQSLGTIGLGIDRIINHGRLITGVIFILMGAMGLLYASGPMIMGFRNSVFGKKSKV